MTDEDDPTIPPPKETLRPLAPPLPPPLVPKPERTPTVPPLMHVEPHVEPPEPAVPEAPATATADDLREAVGVARRPEPKKPKPAAVEAEPDSDDDELDDAPKKRGKGALVLAIALIAAGAIATIVLLGRANGSRYVFHCGANRITAEEGRGFPPWGTRRMGGAAWKPIEIGPDVECRTRETGSLRQLESWYLEALVTQAQAKLTAKEVTGVDAAQDELEQALLLSRDPDRADQRKEIDRLMGDVEYWRATARVKSAIQTLEEAAHRYDAAVDKRPRHVSDSAAWAAWARQAADSLRAGPGGTHVVGPAPVAPTRTDVPTGVALPVEEPDSTEPDVAPVTPVDAGVPRGGVML